MALKDIKNKNSVLRAIGLFNQLGRDRFLEKHGFRKARRYFLIYKGTPYDSKAIVAVAHGIEHPEKGPLRASDFSGGENTVKRKLEALNFMVKSSTDHKDIDSNEPIILVENETTAGGRYDSWKDVTGERYHFPNQYRNKISPGIFFIYYRGTRRANGPRGTPEYFGYGRIGDVWADPDADPKIPKRLLKWFCSIDEYMAFPKPVPFKSMNRTIEDIPKNLWGVGVRSISWDTYKHILKLANIRADQLPSANNPSEPSFPDMSSVNATILENDKTLLVPSRVRKRAPGGSTSAGSGSRRSRYAAKIGKRAEEVVYDHLQKTLPAKYARSLRWVSDEGETPGWDIEYREGSGKRVLIEVKGTSGPKFPNIEITAQEWSAATQYRRSYWLYLVVHCLSKKPVIQMIKDPFGISRDGKFSLYPLLWRLELNGEHLAN